MNFPKSKPTARSCRVTKCFDRGAFRSDLISEISKIGTHYDIFDDTFNKVLDKQNYWEQITSLMVRRQCGKQSWKDLNWQQNTDVHQRMKIWKHGKKHKNYCSNLYKKERKNYYKSLDMNNLTDNKKFWDTIKAIFSNKAKGSSNITLVEDKKLLTSETFNIRKRCSRNFE